jgi:hypothetical protein
LARLEAAVSSATYIEVATMLRRHRRQEVTTEAVVEHARKKLWGSPLLLQLNVFLSQGHRMMHAWGR